MTGVFQRMLDAKYRRLATACVLTLSSDPPQTVRAIDITSGHVVAGAQIETATIAPAAAVRMSELAQKSIAVATLQDGQILMNGKTWRIMSHELRPTPEGEAAGEVYLILADASV